VQSEVLIANVFLRVTAVIQMPRVAYVEGSVPRKLSGQIYTEKQGFWNF